jgi:ferrous iron transport protein A
MMSPLRKLSELKPGQCGVVHSFASSDISIKLMEMGCIPGEQLQIEFLAPLGDPMSIRVAGYQLSLRLNEADQILVEPC